MNFLYGEEEGERRPLGACAPSPSPIFHDGQQPEDVGQQLEAEENERQKVVLNKQRGRDSEPTEAERDYDRETETGSHR